MTKLVILSLIKTMRPIVCAMAFFAFAAQASTIEGHLTNKKGEPIAGAIITLFNHSESRSESVYTDAFGFYQIKTHTSGDLTLRARAPYFSDQLKNIQLMPGETKSISLRLSQEEDPTKLSDALTASAHAATVKFENEEDRVAFRSQCHFCHQMGNELTRRVRTDEQWQEVLDRMQSYGVLINNDNEDGIKHSLITSFDGSPVKALQTHDVSPELSQATYTEWQVGNSASYIHDIEASHQDGKLYGVDMGNDLLYILDPDTHKRETIPFPPSDLPLGGQFSGSIAPLGTFNAKHGPHSIQEGPSGLMWTTNSLAGEIMSFDPKTRLFNLYPIGGDSIYPHTLRFDSKGILWFTLALSNQIGRFDPASKEFTIIDTPSNGIWRWMTDAFLPSMLEVASWFPKKDIQLTLSHHKTSGEGADVLNLPYGLDINPLDGSVWYSKLYAGYIGRLDPVTREVNEIKTPLKGPRRLRFDKRGMLWIPSFEESALMRFNPQNNEFKLYELPTLAKGEYESPYALAVHPETQDIWITSNMSDRVFRFIQSDERFLSYPSPTRVAFLRDMVFLEDGRVCSSNANLPAYAIEGGKPKILCIDPDAFEPVSSDSTAFNGAQK